MYNVSFKGRGPMVNIPKSQEEQQGENRVNELHKSLGEAVEQTDKEIDQGWLRKDQLRESIGEPSYNGIIKREERVDQFNKLIKELTCTNKAEGIERAEKLRKSIDRLA